MVVDTERYLGVYAISFEAQTVGTGRAGHLDVFTVVTLGNVDLHVHVRDVCDYVFVVGHDQEVAARYL